LVGAHNVRKALAVMCVAATAFEISWPLTRRALATFAGVRRRQELIGEPHGIRVYDDFAHHPTAVLETLRALRAKHTTGKIFAVFEPRSATACRNLHQHEYAKAFASADRVIFAPLGRANVPENERLDLVRLAREIGEKATVATSVGAIVSLVASEAREGDTICVLSNGSFGGIHAKILDALEEKRHAR